jgi:hypothetical protein
MRSNGLTSLRIIGVSIQIAKGASCSCSPRELLSGADIYPEAAVLRTKIKLRSEFVGESPYELSSF